MPPLLHRPQADDFRILERHLKAERIDIEGPAGGKVTNNQLGMGHPHDGEGRVEIEGWYWHVPVL